MEEIEAAMLLVNGEEWPLVVKGLQRLGDLCSRDREEAASTVAERLLRDHAPELCLALNSDRERIKSLSAELLTRLVELSPTPASEHLLCHACAALRRRLDSPAPTLEEPSEEVRLQMTVLLREIVRSCEGEASSVMLPYFSPVKAILSKTLKDPFADVRKVSFEIVVLLTRVLKREFHMECEGFVGPLLTSFSHNNNRIRAAAISCLGAVVSNGNADCFEMSVVPMAEKIFDENPRVRLEVARQVGEWMLNYRDRYSCWHKMIPLLLSSMCDDYPDVAEEAERLWNEVGLKYIEENEDDLKDRINFADASPSHYPRASRPNLGCRMIVEQNIGKILPAICRELEEWRMEIRLKSSQLLTKLILFAEFSLLQHVNLAMACLLHGIKDEDVAVVEQICAASELLGYFVEPRMWWKIFSSRIEEWPSLAVMSFVLRGTSKESLSGKYFKKIILKLSVPDIYKTKNVKAQESLIGICESLLESCREDCKTFGQEIFNIVYTIYCICGDEDLSGKSKIILKELQQLFEIDEGDALNTLYERFIKGVLMNITSAVNLWNEQSIDLAILSKCLTEVGPAVGCHLSLLSPILTEALTDKDVNADVKLQIFKSMHIMLLSKDSIFSLTEEQHFVAFLRIIVENIIFPNLVWSAGRTAEAVRTSAICCFCALFDENKFEDVMNLILSEKLDKLFPLLITLTEDNSKLTRLHALQAIYYTTKVTAKSGFTNDHLHKIYPVVLKRLDDSNQKVRLKAVETLTMLFTNREHPYDITLFETHADALYKTLLIHLDDPDEAMKKSVAVSLNELCDIHPELLDKKIKANIPIFSNKCGLIELEEKMKKIDIKNN